MIEISKEIQVLMNRRESLVQGFHRSFDPSRIWQEWERAELRKARDLVGEGRHFRSYRIPAEGRGICLALNVAKESFGGRDPVFLRTWVKACKELRKLSHPLLPPFEILEGINDLYLFVMPFCEYAMSPAEQNSPQVRALTNDLTAGLSRAGLVLDDYLQIRSCRGHPFVIDFSELKITKGTTEGPRLR